MKNIPRWSYASLSKFVLDRNANEYPIWLEGAEPLNPEPKAWAELYMSGPSYHWFPGQHEFDMEVLIAVNVKKDLVNGHTRQTIRGHFQEILRSSPIDVFRYGDPADDPINNQSWVCCYVLRDDVPRQIDGFDYGQVSGSIRLERATVEGYFRMTLDTLENT